MHPFVECTLPFASSFSSSVPNSRVGSTYKRGLPAHDPAFAATQKDVSVSLAAWCQGKLAARGMILQHSHTTRTCEGEECSLNLFWCLQCVEAAGCGFKPAFKLHATKSGFIDGALRDVSLARRTRELSLKGPPVKLISGSSAQEPPNEPGISASGAHNLITSI